MAINPRTPMALMADLGFNRHPFWNPAPAVAFSLLGHRAANKLYASGVTVMPTGGLGAVLQLILAPYVRSLQAELEWTPGTENDPRSEPGMSEGGAWGLGSVVALRTGSIIQININVIIFVELLLLLLSSLSLLLLLLLLLLFW